MSSQAHPHLPDPTPEEGGSAQAQPARELETSAALQEANARLEAVLNSISDGLAVFDRDSRYTYLNKAGARILGVNDDVIGKCVWDVFPEAIGTQFYHEHYRAMETGQPVFFEEYYPAPLNIWIEARCYPSCEGLSVYFLDITERKRIEEALIKKESLFFGLVDLAPNGVYVVDSELRMRHVNALALPVFRQVHPLIGRSLTEIMTVLWGPEAAEQIADIMRRTLETGERAVHPPFSAQRQDVDQEQSYEWETQRVTLPDGSYGVVCYFTDITERLRSERALMESEERMRLATEATGVGIWEWNVSTNDIRWDAQMFRIYGIEPTESGMVNYAIWRSHVVLEDLAEQEAILTRTSREGGRSRREFRIMRRGNGEIRRIRAVETVRHNSRGEVEWVVGTNLDITEEKYAAETIRARTEELETLLDLIPAFVWIAKDGECKVITGNSAANELTRTAPETNISQTSVATGEAIPLRVLKDDGTEYRPDELPMQRAVASKQVVRDALLDFRFPDGRVVQALGNAVPLLDEKGEARGGLGAFHDITELKRVQAALIEARQEAEKANRTKDHFIAVLSHELRTPLTPVMLVLSLWRQIEDLPEMIREDLEMVTRNIELETRLINDLLDLNRISSNKIQLVRKRIDLNQILRHTCGICRPLVDEKNIQVLTDFGPGLEHVTADPVRLQQIFWNVLSNAVKFTPEAGTVEITSRRVEPDRCEIRFRDTGMGLSAETMPRIFDAFDQGSDYITRQFGGLGLGLAICRALVELHGGTIWAESGGEGHGSTFIVVLPLDGRGPINPT